MTGISTVVGEAITSGHLVHLTSAGGAGRPTVRDVEPLGLVQSHRWYPAPQGGAARVVSGIDAFDVEDGRFTGAGRSPAAVPSSI